MSSLKNYTLWIGGAMLAVILFVMFLGPELPFIDKSLSPEKHRWSEQGKLMLPPFQPSDLNWLGSDKNGVDNLSKLVVGTKETIYIVFCIALLRYMIAVPLGLFAYKQKGIAHWILTSFNQIFTFLPVIFSAILLLSMPFIQYSSNRIMWVIPILALLEVGRVAYIVQQQANHISHELFVEAGESLGLSRWRMVRNYYMPSLVPEIIINFCIDVGKVMLLIGQLGVLSIFLTHNWVEVNYFTMKFLNTSMNWVSLLAETRRDIYASKFTFVFYPALAILLTVLTFNLLGEGLRRHFNRRMGSYL
ncbi:ABC transporter permease [Paenibacillus sp. B1-33]|uniref:ABC transporter permease n=1 Tax=unclassified Paenibacillus TaxID=185978 RepID=UPI003D2CC107